MHTNTKTSDARKERSRIDAYWGFEVIELLYNRPKVKYYQYQSGS